MRSLVTHRVEILPINMTPTLPFFHRSPPSPGKVEGERHGNDKHVGEFAPCEDRVRKDDVFETQVVDFEDETQVEDFNMDTQVMDLAGETQVMDLAGETQVMDDFDFIDHMDTQVVDLSDNETDCDSDGTEILEDDVGLNDIQLPDSKGNQTNDIEEHVTSECRQEERSEPTPSDDATRYSGSSRRKFTSVRTASLRDAGFAACNVTPNIAKVGSSPTLSGETVAGENDLAISGQNHLAISGQNGQSSKDKTDVVRSLARKLFMDEDSCEERPDENHVSQKADVSQLPGCDNELAGLSYVDSQEPGELTQANALDFVDKFLKANIFDSDRDVNKRAVKKTVTRGASTKGTKSIAWELNRRSAIGGSSIFEWDDKLEDDGGGEFFSKKKELLLGIRHGVGKSCSKPRRSRQLGTRRNQSHGKLRYEDQEDVHGTLMGLLHSDSKLVNGKRIGQVEETKYSKKAKNHRIKRDAKLVDLVDVGIDTQMAAEGMEALSTVAVHESNCNRMTDQGLQSGAVESESKETQSNRRKTRSVQNRAYALHSGVVTRSKHNKDMTTKVDEEPKCSLPLDSHPQHAIKRVKADQVKLMAKRTRSGVNYSSADHKGVLSDGGAGKASGKGEEINLEEDLDNRQSLPVKRSSRKKESSAKPVQLNTQVSALNHLNGVGNASDCATDRTPCSDIVHIKKRRTRSDMSTECATAIIKTSLENTVTNNIVVDNLKHKGADPQPISYRDDRSGQNGCATSSDGGHEVAFGSIAKRTRSKHNLQIPDSLKGKGLNARAMLSTKNASRMSPEKQDASSSPAKGTLVIGLIANVVGSSKEMQKSTCPADKTPLNVKTPCKSAVSPICAGDEYHNPSCKKKLSMKKELCRLTDSEDKYISPFRVLRERRDMNRARVLFSQHLDAEIVKQQRKIMSRLGVPEASSILEATHFVADMFVRTRNMLEAIANAKFVVTHLWLESCGQANCFIDEKEYILRDIKKEKELSFSMPMSLAHASCHPLLEGRRVLITPNIKPSNEVISSLVKAVHGQAVGRLCRSTSKNDKLLDDLLVLSCEEDLEVCAPLLEKGLTIHSSELLLNGIITQRLEYERYRLFVDHVKKKHAQACG